jgi:NADPH2:quinone reductase
MGAHVFAMIQRGALKITVRHRYPLAAAAAAHQALEARATTGSIVLIA